MIVSLRALACDLFNRLLAVHMGQPVKRSKQALAQSCAMRMLLCWCERVFEEQPACKNNQGWQHMLCVCPGKMPSLQASTAMQMSKHTKLEMCLHECVDG